MVAPSTPPPWETLTRLRRQLRLLIWWSGISQSLIALLMGLLVAGWLDWWWRFDEVGTRLLVAASVWGTAAWTVWRGLILPLRHGLSDVFLAEQIDRRYPGLSHRISAAAQFRAQQLDPRQGSAELQELVIRQAAEDLKLVEPDQLLEPRRLSPVVGVALGACLMITGILWAYPLEASTAMRRIAWPWGSSPWPQSTVLRLSYPDGRPLEWSPRDAIRVVRGEQLELRVENLRGGLPRDLTLQLREQGQEIPEQIPLRRTVHSDRPNATAMELAPFELAATNDAIEFRVVGGDDHSLPWHALTAVDPPRISDVSIEVVPPGYARQPTVTLPPGLTQIRGLLGSKVRLKARADRAVAQLAIRVGDQSAINIPLLEDRQSWQTELTIDQPSVSNFSFLLRDSEGFSEQQPLQFELRGEVDAIPEVVLSEPGTDLWVTPTAVVPINAAARDDLGLTTLNRTWQRTGQDGDAEQELEAFLTHPTQARYTGEWSLGDLKLQPGDRVVFRLEARDACDYGAPHIGMSAPRTLLVVTAEEKQSELTDRIAELVGELSDAVTQQERLAGQTDELHTQLRDVGKLQSADRDLLHRLQGDQRRLASHLGDELRGLRRHAEQIRGEFPANQLSDSEAEPQLEQLGQQMRELTEAAFPAIETELTQAAKNLDAGDQVKAGPSASQGSAAAPQASEGAANPLVGQSLQRAAELQREVAAALAERHRELSKWQNDRDLGDDLKGMASAQQQLNLDSAELGARTMSRSLPELSPQDRADLNKLADRQRLLSQRMEPLQRAFRELSERLEESDTARAAEALDLADQLREAQLSMRLRQAGEDLAANRLGSAGPAQREAEETLRKLNEQWLNGRPDDSEQMLKRTEEARQSAEHLGDDLDELRKETDGDNLTQASEGQRQTLLEQAQELRRRAERLERQLQRLRLKQAADSARQAAQRMQAAEPAIAAGDSETAQQELSSAQETVEQLQQEIAAAQHEVQEHLAQEELERVAGTLQGLKVRQEGVVAETERLENERKSTGRLTRGQQRSLQDLAAVERELQQLAVECRNQLQQAVVAQSALASVARNLEQAAERLGERQTDAVTLMLERDAAKRLGRIIEAWNRQEDNAKKATEGDSPTPEGEAEEAPMGGPPGEAISFQRQLALLRELQADCLDRTAAFEALRQSDGTLPADLLPLLADLAQEQGELIELARKLLDLYRQSQATAIPASAEPAQEAPQ